MRRAPDIIELTFVDLMRGSGLEPLPREAVPAVAAVVAQRREPYFVVYETPTARWRFDEQGGLVRYVAYDAEGDLCAWWDRDAP